MYRKSYIDGHNILNGDCIVGGLLELGRQQHKMNGEYVTKRVREALDCWITSADGHTVGFFVTRTWATAHSSSSPLQSCQYVDHILLVIVVMNGLYLHFALCIIVALRTSSCQRSISEVMTKRGRWDQVKRC